MLRDLLTLRTEDAIGIEPVLEPFEARCIVWKFAVEFHHRERAIGRFRAERIIAIRLAHALMCIKSTYLRQGDTYQFIPPVVVYGLALSMGSFVPSKMISAGSGRRSIAGRPGEHEAS